MAKNPLTVKPSLKFDDNLDAYPDSEDSQDSLDSQDSQDQTFSNHSIVFDEDKYSVDETVLFRAFLTSIGIAVRNCVTRTRELSVSATEAEEQRVQLQSQLDDARAKLKAEE